MLSRFRRERVRKVDFGDAAGDNGVISGCNEGSSADFGRHGYGSDAVDFRRVERDRQTVCAQGDCRHGIVRICPDRRFVDWDRGDDIAVLVSCDNSDLIERIDVNLTHDVSLSISFGLQDNGEIAEAQPYQQFRIMVMMMSMMAKEGKPDANIDLKH